MSYSDSFDDYSFLLSNSSGNSSVCGGEKLEGGASVALGVFLAAASFLAYIPQVLEIILKKSSDGVSYWSIFLAHTAGIASLLAGIFTKWDILYCCLHVGFEICAESLLVVISLMVPVVGQTLIWTCLLVYFPTGGDREKQREFRRACLACLVDWIAGLAFSAACGVMLWRLGSGSKALSIFANAMGIAGVVLTCIQWLPQIWKTWTAGKRGSLSLIMLLIQCPGSVIITLYFGAVRHYKPEVWLSYAVAATMQAVLIGLITYYFVREKMAAKSGGAEGESQEPLLGDNVSINTDNNSIRRF